MQDKFGNVLNKVISIEDYFGNTLMEIIIDNQGMITQYNNCDIADITDDENGNEVIRLQQREQV